MGPNCSRLVFCSQSVVRSDRDEPDGSVNSDLWFGVGLDTQSSGIGLTPSGSQIAFKRLARIGHDAEYFVGLRQVVFDLFGFYSLAAAIEK